MLFYILDNKKEDAEKGNFNWIKVNLGNNYPVLFINFNSASTIYEFLNTIGRKQFYNLIFHKKNYLEYIMFV